MLIFAEFFNFQNWIFFVIFGFSPKKHFEKTRVDSNEYPSKSFSFLVHQKLNLKTEQCFPHKSCDCFFFWGGGRWLNIFLRFNINVYNQTEMFKTGIQIGIKGASGVGKSMLINAIRGLPFSCIKSPPPPPPVITGSIFKITVVSLMEFQDLGSKIQQ